MKAGGRLMGNQKQAVVDLVERHREEGRRISEVLGSLGVARSSYYRWRKGPADKAAPRQSSYQITEEERGRIEEVKEAQDLGIPAVMLFGLPEQKDAVGSSGYADDGIIPRAVNALKKAVPGITVITDVCLCEYTSHGHCGVVEGDHVLNDASVDLLATYHREGLDRALAEKQAAPPSSKHLLLMHAAVAGMQWRLGEAWELQRLARN